MENLLIKINKSFKPVVHPFNLQNDGVKTYSLWQFEKGKDTIANYLSFTNEKEMFEDKVVLDVGCGAGGKSLYYASKNAKLVHGVDIVESYENEANQLAHSLGLSDKFKFSIADASKLHFDDNSFDTIIMNDAMEHVDDPEGVLQEVLRVLKPTGLLYINFPPYNHPFGAHLSDAIFIPWVHLFFSDKTLIKAYKKLVSNLPDGNDRINFRISSKNGEEYFSYINKMSIKRFNKILKKFDITPMFYKEMPLRNILKPFAKLPFLKEYFVKMVVCVIR